MIDERIVREIVENHIAQTNYFVVDVSIDKENNIVVEIDSEDDVPLDYCVELSRHIEAQLDRDKEDFNLEVGSAGLTSPFKVLRQYKKHEGDEVEVQVKNGLKHTGRLVQVCDTTFGIEIVKKVKKEGEKKKVEEKEILTFPYEQIKYTKYSITFK